MVDANAGRTKRAESVGFVSFATEERFSVEESRDKLRPEIDLLICCARLRLLAPERKRIMCLIRGELDWASLIYLASGHGLLPLLYRHLNTLAPAPIPSPVFVELWARYESNARRNRAMAAELLNILGMFEANGIPAIAFKGPSLAAAVYGDLGLREFGDLDILLRRKDVLIAKKLLQTQGYVPTYDLTLAVEATFLRSRMHYDLALVHKTREVMVELHWKTDADCPVEPFEDEHWWANLRHVSLCEQNIRCFATEELFVILCVHGAKHTWCSMGWLVDVAEMIRQNVELDWELILCKAAQIKCERRLAVGLYLAAHLLDAPLPEKVHNWIDGRPQVKKLGAKTLEMMFHPDPDVLNSFEGLRLRLSILYEHPWQRLLYCMKALVAPSFIEWSRFPLPRGLFFLYLPNRLFRLITNYALPMTIKRRLSYFNSSRGRHE